MPEAVSALSRRAILAGGLILPLAPGLALAAPRNLTFAVFRNGAKIGEHHVTSPATRRTSPPPPTPS